MEVSQGREQRTENRTDERRGEESADT